MTDPGDDVVEIGSASLIATFYGMRASTAMRDLHLRLYRGLASDPVATATPANPWWADDDTAALRRDDPPGMAAHDTAVVQVALNASGPVAVGWETLRLRLSSLVGDTPPGIWGRTLVYQAALAPDEAIGPDMDAALGRLLNAPPLRGLHPLGHADVAGGRIWLLAVPRVGEHLSATTVYAALAPAEAEKDFGPTALWGPASWLMLPDLIATKGFFQRREHLGVDPQGTNRDDRYRDLLDALRSVTEQVLGDLGNQMAKTGRIDALARTYGQVTQVLPMLRQMHISLLQQVHNFNEEHRRLGDSSLLQFLRQHLNTTAYELELKVADGEDALNAARGASDLAHIRIDREQVRIDRDQEQRQYLIQTILALVSAGFAVPQIVDRTAAREILQLFGHEATSIWELILVQVGAILLCAPVFAVLVTLIARLFVRWQRRMSPS